MTEPMTVNKGLIIPNTGDLPGTWGSAALNPDYVSLDGMLGGFQTLTLSTGATVLTAPSGFTATPGPGPTQSQNAMLTLSGTLSGNCTVTFPLPGFYIIENICVVGAFYIKLQSSSPGNVVCAPPGEAVHIFNDGTNVRYVNLGRVGSQLNLTTSTVPAWITNCTVPPYLLADGSTFTGATYPTLAAMLGGTTLPDLRGRVWASLNGGSSRITTVGSGIDGNTILSGGGAENVVLDQINLPAVDFAVSNHVHSSQQVTPVTIFQGSGTAFQAGGTLGQGANTGAQTAAVTAASGGSGTAVNKMPPVCVGGITLIRAG